MGRIRKSAFDFSNRIAWWMVRQKENLNSIIIENSVLKFEIWLYSFRFGLSFIFETNTLSNCRHMAGNPLIFSHHLLKPFFLAWEKEQRWWPNFQLRSLQPLYVADRSGTSWTTHTHTHMFDACRFSHVACSMSIPNQRYSRLIDS